MTNRIKRKMVLKWIPFCIILCLFLLIIYQVYSCVLISKLRNPYILETLSGQNEMFYKGLSNHSYKINLLPNIAPVVVHYLWCSSAHFSFNHYLSIRSVVRSFQPDKIVLHYKKGVIENPTGSSVDWFADIRRQIPLLVLHETPANDLCTDHGLFSADFQLGDYINPNGIFIFDDVIIDNFTRQSYNNYLKQTYKCSRYSLDNGLQSCISDIDRPLVGRVFFLGENQSSSSSNSSGVLVIKCPHMDDLHRATNDCVQLTKDITPKDIWNSEGKFSELSRSIVYDSKDPIRSQVHAKSSIPRHGHVLHFTTQNIFGFSAYVSILSSLYVFGLEHVFVHSNVRPSGYLWDNLQNHNVTFVPVQFLPEWSIKDAEVSYGLYALMHYGGMLIRSNTFWRKPIAKHLLSFATVATTRATDSESSPTSIDLNLLLSQSRSTYIRNLLFKLTHNSVHEGLHDIGEMAYHLYETDPTFVKVESNLLEHVTCREYLCNSSAAHGDASLDAPAVHVLWHEDKEPISLEDALLVRGPIMDIFKKYLGLTSLSTRLNRFI